MKYPIAPNGIYHTFQGEGHLLGEPMRFVRLGGCSVGCPECDTNYTVHTRMTVEEIAAAVDALPRTEWTFITGGEPFDHDLRELIATLPRPLAAVTSGMVRRKWMNINDLEDEQYSFDFLSVSPHGTPDKLEMYGDQINLVPGLNGLKLSDWQNFDFSGFEHKYITPLAGGLNQRECERWVAERPFWERWRLGIQAHKTWNLP